MRIAKLTISYDRGLERNDEKDLFYSASLGEDVAKTAINAKGATTADGKIIRGLGTHFKSQRDQELVKKRDQIASQIRQAFRERFVATSIDGVYVLTESGAGKDFVSELPGMLLNEMHENDVKLRVQEFDLVTEDLDAGELRAWSERIKNQLASVQLGRKKELDEDGLNALVTLSQAPIISAATGRRIRELVEALRERKIDRIEIKRQIAQMDVEIEEGAVLAPRRLAGVR